MPLLGRDKVVKMTEEYYLRVNTGLRKIAIKGFTQIIKQTPVETGRARNNWFLTTGLPSGKLVDDDGFPTNPKLPKRVLNNKIFFTNNLPYIGVLEYGGYPNPAKTKSGKTAGGFSRQAPGGWVRTELIDMANKIRSLKT